MTSLSEEVKNLLDDGSLGRQRKTTDERSTVAIPSSRKILIGQLGC
jgi:hypothetical protein